MQEIKKILITNASHISLAATRSLGRKGIEVTSISPEKRSITFYSRYCKHRIITPFAPENEGYIEYLEQIVKNEKFDVLLPGGSGLIFTISKYRDKLSPYTKIPITNKENIEISRDKSKTLKYAMKFGIPCPKTFFSEDIDQSNMREIAQEIGFPAVIKPDIGTGATGISYANSLQELEYMYEKTIKEHGSSHIQEYIRGKKYSGSALFNQDGLPRRGCVQQGLRQIPFTGGSQIYVVSVKQSQVLDYTFEFLKALKWYGIAEIEFIVDDKDKCPKLLDLNPRLYGSVCLPIAAGVDYPYLLYRLAMDGDVEPDFNYKLGVKCRYLFPNELRYFFSILTNRRYKHLENPGVLRAFLNFIQFYEPKLNYFVMSAEDPFPAAVNSLQYIEGFIERKICRIKNKIPFLRVEENGRDFL